MSLIEQFHEIGHVYNDLKLDNICVGTFGLNDKKCQLKLIDFGIATSYVTTEGKFKKPSDPSHHIKLERRLFNGNMGFCSPNQLKKKATSRRDDLYSILFILMYLTNNKLPFFDDSLPIN